jgi:alpha-tubulin suppressor-like RCC1 family protein
VTTPLYDSNGDVYACGDNASGDLGIGRNGGSSTPVPVQGLQGVSVTSLVASYEDSGALLADGTYEDWGSNDLGQLGDGSVAHSSDVPVVVSLPAGVTQAVEGGSFSNNGQTLVMLSDGSLYAWGDDQFGQLGDDKAITESTPVQFSLLGDGSGEAGGGIEVLHAVRLLEDNDGSGVLVLQGLVARTPKGPQVGGQGSEDGN